MSEWVSEWMSEWVNAWMNGWVNEWMSEWVRIKVMGHSCRSFSCEWVNEWVSEWMSEWVSEWMNEWMSEWMNEWVNWIPFSLILNECFSSMHFTIWFISNDYAKVNEWMNEWVNEQTSEWVNEWMSEWVNEYPFPLFLIKAFLPCISQYGSSPTTMHCAFSPFPQSVHTIHPSQKVFPPNVATDPLNVSLHLWHLEPCEWMNEWMSEWVNGWVSEWVNEEGKEGWREGHNTPFAKSISTECGHWST